jgi:hypothetical protein
MEQHVYSTGDLTLTPLLVPQTSWQQPVGGGSLVAVQSLLYKNWTTVSFGSAATAAAGAWALIDLGASLDVTRVALYGCTDSPAGAAGVKVWVSNSATATPGGAGTTALGSSSPAPGADAQSVVVSSVTAINGRYLIIATANVGAGLSVSFSQVQVWGDVIPISVVHAASDDLTWTEHLLYTNANDSRFAIDVAFDDAHWLFKGENCSIRADALAQLAKMQLGGSQPLVVTLGAAVTIPAGILVFSAIDTQGKTIVLTFNLARTKGKVSLPWREKDYVMQDFDFEALPDPTGVLGTWAMHQ